MFIAKLQKQIDIFVVLGKSTREYLFYQILNPAVFVLASFSIFYRQWPQIRNSYQGFP